MTPSPVVSERPHRVGCSLNNVWPCLIYIVTRIWVQWGRVIAPSVIKKADCTICQETLCVISRICYKNGRFKTCLCFQHRDHAKLPQAVLGRTTYYTKTYLEALRQVQKTCAHTAHICIQHLNFAYSFAFALVQRLLQ